MVSAASGAALADETQSLPVSVSPRQLTVSFDPGMVRLVRGGAADDTASADVSVSVVPALEGDERLTLELTSGVAGNLGVMPNEATLSSETRAVTVTVTAGLGMVSTEVVAFEGSGTSIGNAVVSSTPLTVEVVRGVALSISGVEGADVVSFSAGTSTELLVTTSPTLTGSESVEVRLTVEGAGLTLTGSANTVELSSAQPSATVSLRADKLDVSGQVAATGTGQNVEVVRGDFVEITTEPAKAVSVTFDPAAEVRIERGRSETLTVGTSLPLSEGQSVTVSLSVLADSGFTFGSGESTKVVLTSMMGSASVLVRSSTAIGARTEVDVAPEGEGLSVNAPEPLELISVTPVVSVVFSVDGEDLAPGEALVLPANRTMAVSLRLEDYTLAVGQEAVLAVSVEGEGLTADPLEVTLSGTAQSAMVAVTGTIENTSGTLTASAVSGVELRDGPAELPVSVVKPEGIRLRIRVFLEGALE